MSVLTEEVSITCDVGHHHRRVEISREARRGSGHVGGGDVRPGRLDVFDGGRVHVQLVRRGITWIQRSHDPSPSVTRTSSTTSSTTRVRQHKVNGTGTPQCDGRVAKAAIAKDDLVVHSWPEPLTRRRHSGKIRICSRGSVRTQSLGLCTVAAFTGTIAEPHQSKPAGGGRSRPRKCSLQLFRCPEP